MATILALHLGKFKTVACVYEIDSGKVRFQTVPSARVELAKLLAQPTDFEDLRRSPLAPAQPPSTKGEAR